VYTRLGHGRRLHGLDVIGTSRPAAIHTASLAVVKPTMHCAGLLVVTPSVKPLPSSHEWEQVLHFEVTVQYADAQVCVLQACDDGGIDDPVKWMIHAVKFVSVTPSTTHSTSRYCIPPPHDFEHAVQAVVAKA
jgi:hypothetical protein